MQTQEEVMIIKGKRSKRRYNSSTTATSSSFTSDVVSSSHDDQEEEQDLANCLILLAKGPDHHKPLSDPTMENFQCKTCNKSFPSFQALGGHRASHKRPNKPTIDDFQIKRGDDSTILSLRMISSDRVHECSICGAEFSSGQALGGHMRRHRAVQPPENEESKEAKRPRNLMLSLDLNLPAAPEDDDHLESKFPFVTKEQVIVFSNTSLVDCHY